MTNDESPTKRVMNTGWGSYRLGRRCNWGPFPLGPAPKHWHNYLAHGSGDACQRGENQGIFFSSCTLPMFDPRLWHLLSVLHSALTFIFRQHSDCLQPNQMNFQCSQSMQNSQLNRLLIADTIYFTFGNSLTQQLHSYCSFR